MRERNQRIGRDLVDAEAERSLYIGLCFLKCLGWQREHKVQVDCLKTCLHDPLTGLVRNHSRVTTTEYSQEPIVEGLYAKAHTSDSRAPQGTQYFIAGRDRMHLYSNFASIEAKVTGNPFSGRFDDMRS